MTLTILVNARGGHAGADAADRIAAACADAGVNAQVEVVKGAAVAARAAALARDGARVVGVAGGDGTIGSAAGALAGTGTALAVIPLGTLNHLARDLGVPADLDKAAAMIAAGHVRAIDVAEVNGRVFVNNSAIGLYPLMVMDRDSQQKRLGRSKRLAMLVASARTLAQFHDHRLRLTVNEDEEGFIDTPLLFVGNNDYRLAMPHAGRRDALDDGRLCVMVMRKKGVPGLIAATLRALVGLTREDDMIQLPDVQRLRVDSRRHRLDVSIDGEVEHVAPPLDYRIRAGALKVVVPA